MFSEVFVTHVLRISGDWRNDEGIVKIFFLDNRETWFFFLFFCLFWARCRVQSRAEFSLDDKRILAVARRDSDLIDVTWSLDPCNDPCRSPLEIYEQEISSDRYIDHCAWIIRSDRVPDELFSQFSKSWRHDDATFRAHLTRLPSHCINKAKRNTKRAYYLANCDGIRIPLSFNAIMFITCRFREIRARSLCFFT